MSTSALTVRDLMSAHVKHAHPDDPVPEAHSTMRMVGVRHLPVLDDDGALVGILSDRDLFLAWGTRDRPVAEVMTRQPAVIAPDTPASEAAARMLHEKIGSLVVIKDGKLVGILTESDLMRVAYAALRDGFDAQKLRG